VEICGILGAANAASTVIHRGGTSGQCGYKDLIKLIKYYQILDMGGGRISIEFLHTVHRY
jgi:hypothetical protein